MRRRQLGQQPVRLHKAVQRVGAALHHAQAAAKIAHRVVVALDAVDARQQAAGDGLDGRKRVGKLVAQHADQALPRGLFLFLQRQAHVGQQQQRVRRAILAEDGFAQQPARRAWCRRSGCVWSGAASRSSSPSSRARAAEAARSRASPAAATPALFTSCSRFSRSKANSGACMTSRMRASSAVASSERTRCFCSRSASALISAASSPRASWRAGAARAKGVVALAQRGDNVGERLQRADQALDQRGGDEQQDRCSRQADEQKRRREADRAAGREGCRRRAARAARAAGNRATPGERPSAGACARCLS